MLHVVVSCRMYCLPESALTSQIKTLTSEGGSDRPKQISYLVLVPDCRNPTLSLEIGSSENESLCPSDGDLTPFHLQIAERCSAAGLANLT